MTNRQPQQQYEIGMVGFCVMGRNLLLSMAHHGFSVAGYDKDPAKVKTLAALPMMGLFTVPNSVKAITLLVGQIAVLRA